MKKAVIIVVINDEDGVDLMKILEAKTDQNLQIAIAGELTKVIRNFHESNDYLEFEDENYINDVVVDMLAGDEVYSPSSYAGSGFVQLRYL